MQLGEVRTASAFYVNMLQRKVTLLQVQMLYSRFLCVLIFGIVFLSEMRRITRAYTFSQLMQVHATDFAFSLRCGSRSTERSDTKQFSK